MRYIQNTETVDGRIKKTNKNVNKKQNLNLKLDAMAFFLICTHKK